MSDSTTASTEDRIDRIRNLMREISRSSTFFYPTPATGKNWEENWDKQEQVLDAVHQARLAWDLATFILDRGCPADLNIPGRLASELADTVYRFLRFEGQFPAHGKNPEVDVLVDFVERALDRALTALRQVPRANDGQLRYKLP
ncbi:MAG: hypothetical protein KF747_03465 [Nitrospira sp.]|nr:hypothetical protein [Nitrospira sp.]